MGGKFGSSVPTALMCWSFNKCMILMNGVCFKGQQTNFPMILDSNVKVTTDMTNQTQSSEPFLKFFEELINLYCS